MSVEEYRHEDDYAQLLPLPSDLSMLSHRLDILEKVAQFIDKDISLVYNNKEPERARIDLNIVEIRMLLAALRSAADEEWTVLEKKVDKLDGELSELCDILEVPMTAWYTENDGRYLSTIAPLPPQVLKLEDIDVDAYTHSIRDEMIEIVEYGHHPMDDTACINARHGDFGDPQDCISLEHWSSARRINPGTVIILDFPTEEFTNKPPSPRSAITDNIPWRPMGSAFFEYFPRIPAEIRIKIWNLSLPDPRIIHLNYDVFQKSRERRVTRWTYWDGMKHQEHFWGTWEFGNKFSPMALHRVCQESRFVCLEKYRLIGFGETQRCFIDIEKDTFFVNTNAVATDIILDGYEWQQDGTHPSIHDTQQKTDRCYPVVEIDPQRNPHHYELDFEELVPKSPMVMPPTIILQSEVIRKHLKTLAIRNCFFSSWPFDIMTDLMCRLCGGFSNSRYREAFEKTIILFAQEPHRVGDMRLNIQVVTDGVNADTLPVLHLEDADWWYNDGGLKATLRSKIGFLDCEFCGRDDAPEGHRTFRHPPRALIDFVELVDVYNWAAVDADSVCLEEHWPAVDIEVLQLLKHLPFYLAGQTYGDTIDI